MFSIKNILESFIHKVCVGDSLFLENEFFPYPPFEKYKYQVFAKEGSVSVSKTLLPQEKVFIAANGNYTVSNEIIKFKFNYSGIVFIDIFNTTRPNSKPISIVVEVSTTDDDLEM